MNRLVKLHIGLFRYLKAELPKQKTTKEVIKFLLNIIGAYFKEVFRLFKTLFLIFNKEYRKQKKQFDKMQQIKVELNRALKILRYIDKKSQDAGVPRWKMRQFWRDFTKNGAVRQDVFDDLLKDINQIK